VADVASANSLSARAKLHKGQVLVIPKPEAPVAVASSAKHGKKNGKAGRPERKETAPEVTAVRSYRVRGGDTLYRIAVRNGTTVERLRDVNRLSAKSAIKPGDRLRLPS
jgi:LysM repeat protein